MSFKPYYHPGAGIVSGHRAVVEEGRSGLAEDYGRMDCLVR